ncbi:hypothetical protein D9M71_181210 [compost metagenome]
MATESTSLSLASTLPLAGWPGVPLFTPPASMATPLSSRAMGVSLAPPMTITSCELDWRPKRSAIV